MIANNFEHAYYSRLTNFLDSNKVFNKSQSGFCSGRSTEGAIHDFMGNVYRSLDKGLYVTGLFFDVH